MRSVEYKIFKLLSLSYLGGGGCIKIHIGGKGGGRLHDFLSGEWSQDRIEGNVEWRILLKRHSSPYQIILNQSLLISRMQSFYLRNCHRLYSKRLNGIWKNSSINQFYYLLNIYSLFSGQVDIVLSCYAVAVCQGYEMSCRDEAIVSHLNFHRVCATFFRKVRFNARFLQINLITRILKMFSSKVCHFFGKTVQFPFLRGWSQDFHYECYITIIFRHFYLHFLIAFC